MTDGQRWTLTVTEEIAFLKANTCNSMIVKKKIDILTSKVQGQLTGSGKLTT